MKIFPFTIVILAVVLALCGLGAFLSDRGMIHVFDTGIYLQILANLWWRGSWASSFVGENNFLAHHFQPLVAITLPFYLVSPGAPALFFASGMAVSITACLIAKKAMDDGLPGRYVMAIPLAFILYPAVATRLFYGFVPEILTLPLLLWQGIALTKKAPMTGRDFLWLAAIQMVTGLGKETLWLTNAWIALLLTVAGRLRPRWGVGLTLANLIIFAALFGYWMPRHTTLNNYYALRYYGLEHGIDFHTPIVLLANLFSTRSLETMGYSVLLLTCGLPFLSRSWVVLAALPGLMLILISTNAIVHDYRNHYLAPVLPFLALSSIDAVANRSWLGHPKIKRWLPLFLIITPLFVTVPEQFKLIKKTQMHGETQHIHADAAELASSIAPHAHLLVDGNLGPFFHQFENIQVILGFLGNPNTFDRAKLDRVTDVVTLVDARQFGDCRAIKPSSEDQMMYDYQGFYDYCEWLKNTAWKSIIRRPASGMLHFSRDAL